MTTKGGSKEVFLIVLALDPDQRRDSPLPFFGMSLQTAGNTPVGHAFQIIDALQW